MSVARATLRVVRRKGHQMEFRVYGTDSNGEAYAVIVKAPYGHKAIQYAEKLLGVKFKSASAMRLGYFSN